MKPILACDYDPKKGSFPYMAFPKIDGVRGLNIEGYFVGRSGKKFANKLNTNFYTDKLFKGFDGEMVLDRITGFGICNDVTSALTTIKGDRMCRWCLFDLVNGGVNSDTPYLTRYNHLVEVVTWLQGERPELVNRLWVIPFTMVYNQAELDAFELKCLEEQYEGVILRDPNGLYKYGRTTAKEANYLRIKRFQDEEIVVTGVREGQTNHNKATLTPNGYTERATLAENMVPNGLIGTIIGKCVKDVFFNETLLFPEGMEIEISPGRMAHGEREHYFRNADEIIGKIVKYQFFPVGVKDKPRFPTFQGFRDPVDMG